MRFNPLWLFLLPLMPWLGMFFMPLLLLLAVLAGLAMFAGASSLWLARAPRQLWLLLSRPRVRSAYALANAASRVLADRGVSVRGCFAEENRFFLSGTDDENAVYEAALQALARLRGGQSDLVVLPASPLFRAVTAVAVAAAALTPLAALGLLGLIAAVALGIFASPYLSPLVQKALLSHTQAAALSVTGAAFRTRAVSALGGRLRGNESGVEVSLQSSGAIEAEIVDD